MHFKESYFVQQQSHTHLYLSAVSLCAISGFVYNGPAAAAAAADCKEQERMLEDATGV